MAITAMAVLVMVLEAIMPMTMIQGDTVIRRIRRRRIWEIWRQRQIRGYDISMSSYWRFLAAWDCLVIEDPDIDHGYVCVTILYQARQYEDLEPQRYSHQHVVHTIPM